MAQEKISDDDMAELFDAEANQSIGWEIKDTIDALDVQAKNAGRPDNRWKSDDPNLRYLYYSAAWQQSCAIRGRDRGGSAGHLLWGESLHRKERYHGHVWAVPEHRAIPTRLRRWSRPSTNTPQTISLILPRPSPLSIHHRYSGRGRARCQRRIARRRAESAPFPT